MDELCSSAAQGNRASRLSTLFRKQYMSILPTVCRWPDMAMESKYPACSCVALLMSSQGVHWGPDPLWRGVTRAPNAAPRVIISISRQAFSSKVNAHRGGTVASSAALQPSHEARTSCHRKGTTTYHLAVPQSRVRCQHRWVGPCPQAPTVAAAATTPGQYSSTLIRLQLTTSFCVGTAATVCIVSMPLPAANAIVR